jgi:hypothetical protein
MKETRKLRQTVDDRSLHTVALHVSNVKAELVEVSVRSTHDERPSEREESNSTTHVNTHGGGGGERGQSTAFHIDDEDKEVLSSPQCFLSKPLRYKQCRSL